MKQLSPEQHTLVTSLAERLGNINGMKAVVVGGSHARGRAKPESDIDLGLFYLEAAPFSIQHVRELAEAVNDAANPVVMDFYGWGPWVNGGAWLTIGGQRVDFIYRSLEHVERVITAAEAGRYELDYLQQPPFGFFSPTYLGETAICVPLFDPEARVEALKQRVASYPEALRRAIVRDFLWQVEFNLTAFASKFTARADAYGTTACLTRAVNQLVLALFALNRQYLLNDKTALTEVGEFALTPPEFGPRVQQALAQAGNSTVKLDATVESVAQLFRETVELTEGLYQPRFILPK
jgi:predicted nucleotidyltransferase